MPVDVRKVSDLRKLRYDTPHDFVADADRLASGAVRTPDNHTFEQIPGHLALVMNTSIDGSHEQLHFPWSVRLVARLFRGIIFQTG